MNNNMCTYDSKQLRVLIHILMLCAPAWENRCAIPTSSSILSKTPNAHTGYNNMHANPELAARSYAILEAKPTYIIPINHTQKAQKTHAYSQA